MSYWIGRTPLQKNIIDFLRDSIFKQNIRGFEEFYSLYNEYSNLWNFEMIYSELLHRCKILEPTPIDWFESDFIQKIITDIEPQSGGEIIKNINKLIDLLHTDNEWITHIVE